MKAGRTYTDVAQYLPVEDGWIAGLYPKELQLKWSWGAYELRYARPASELKGYHPLWIGPSFLRAARYEGAEFPCPEPWVENRVEVPGEMFREGAAGRRCFIEGFPGRAPRRPHPIRGRRCRVRP
jgi:hypothetical protein